MATAKKVTSVKKTAAPAAAPVAQQVRPVVSALTPAQLQVQASKEPQRGTIAINELGSGLQWH